jgi:hypothetical protein
MGVGAEEKEVGPTALEPPGLFGQQLTRPPPLTGILQPFDLLEVDAVHQDFRGVLPAQAAPHLLIDDAVVLRRRLPAHPAKQTDHSHGSNGISSKFRIGTQSLVSLAGCPDLVFMATLLVNGRRQARTPLR